VLHTSLACQYQAWSHRFFEMNSFSTAALCAVFLAPACSIFGSAAQRFKLPRITGYLVAGIAAGPYLLKLLTQDSVARLWFVDQACLSVIALAAGAELQWEQLDKIKKQVRQNQCHSLRSTWGQVHHAVAAAQWIHRRKESAVD
jgi:Kef-type K+ transport system membrane component KefB